MKRSNWLTRCLIAGALATGASLAMTGCEDEPDDIEDVVDNVGDAAEDAADNVDDAIDDLTDQ